MKRLIIRLLIGALFSLVSYQSAFAHAGEEHSKNCFLKMGDTRLLLSGYQFQLELEGKHFCHFFPALGQIVLVVEPLKEGLENKQITLELSALTSWMDWPLNSAQAFTVIKQEPAQRIGTGLVSISQTIRQRGIYRLNITLQDDSGDRQQQRFTFLVGFPVTKILVVIALVLVLVIGFAGVRDLKKKG
ncbi:MAG: hypothetical protein WC762_08800 [Methylobacter sp.]